MTNFAAITEPKKVGELMRDIEGYQGTFVVRCAFRLSPLLFVRPGELRKMEWKDVDLDKAQWVYLVTKTDTVYYCDGPEVLRHPTQENSRTLPHFFVINYAIGGISGWKINLLRDGNATDMWVDYVRAYQGEATP